jgi:hypothetical protein
LYGGFHKLPGLEDSKEYQDLPDDVREFLAKDKVPHYEFVSNGLLYPPGTPITPGNSYMTFIAVLLNSQSEGSVTLRSSDAADKPVIQLNYVGENRREPGHKAACAENALGPEEFVGRGY